MGRTRATFIKTYDGRRVVIPNAMAFSQSVVVNTAYPQRRLQYDVGIGYGDGIDKARGLMRGVEVALAGIEREPARPE